MTIARFTEELLRIGGRGLDYIRMELKWGMANVGWVDGRGELGANYVQTGEQSMRLKGGQHRFIHGSGEKNVRM